MTDNHTDTISSLYPPPPPYISFFTSENVAQVKKLRQQHKDNADEIISNTKDLRFLVPPKPPNKPSYRSFGDVWNFEDKFITLKESGIVQLYDNAPNKDQDEEEEIFTQERIEELKKMTKSLLLNFLEFVGLLAKNPPVAFQKIEHIRIILINLHHLLNSYRLHQSREGLILKIEEKINQDNEVIARIEKTCENIETKIKMLLTDEVQFNDSTVDKQEQVQEEESTSLDDKDVQSLKREAVKSIVNSIKNEESAS